MKDRNSDVFCLCYRAEKKLFSYLDFFCWVLVFFCSYKVDLVGLIYDSYSSGVLTFHSLS